MRFSEDIYAEFLEEMNSLENFRIAHVSDYPHVPLERDDPDVRRLVEAMAFFSARTRVAALSNVLAVQRRVFQQFFPFLLSPVPATGIVQAGVTGQFTETAFFPKGTELAASVPGEGTAFFRTLCDLRVLPVRLTTVKTLLLPDRGFRFLLRLSASFPRNDEIGTLSFHINHLNDYQASLRVFHSIRSHLRAVSVIFNEEATEVSIGAPCRTSYGLPLSAPGENEESVHPLLAERWFFHLPQQELYLHAEIPTPPRNWQHFTLCLDMGPGWPRSVFLNEDIFQLFAVPVLNLRRGPGEPVICEGTQERYPIRHPQPEHRFALHSVLGVYEINDRKRMVPMKPGVISGGVGSYEIDQNVVQERLSRSVWLLPHFPEAFQFPRTVVVDALWLQPWYSDALNRRQQLQLYDRTLVGLKWDWLGAVKPHAENPLLKQADAFTHLFTLTHKSVLNEEDIGSLLRALGTVRTGEFQVLLPVLGGGRVESMPQRRSARDGLIRHVYHLLLKEYDPVLRPLLETFVQHMERILDIWISDATIEVRMEAMEEQPGAKGGL